MSYEITATIFSLDKPVAADIELATEQGIKKVILMFVALVPGIC